MNQTLRPPEPVFGRTLRIRGLERLSDEKYWAFCLANPDTHIERTATREIVIAPPEGGESAYRNTVAGAELGLWAGTTGHGKAFGPTVQFFLPDGSGLSPDAAWVSNESLRRLTKAERKKYLRLTPEFVIEVLSLSENLQDAKTKMEAWIKNGVQLAWLIDGDAETVYIYRPGHAVKTRRHLKELAGEGPVAGFVLNLTRIWEGL